MEPMDMVGTASGAVALVGAATAAAAAVWPLVELIPNLQTLSCLSDRR
jgi:hypothetical protein